MTAVSAAGYSSSLTRGECVGAKYQTFELIYHLAFDIHSL